MLSLFIEYVISIYFPKISTIIFFHPLSSKKMSELPSLVNIAMPIQDLYRYEAKPTVYFRSLVDSKCSATYTEEHIEWENVRK